MEGQGDSPMQLTVGASLGPYCIERKLGQGGMAEVYSARDTRLGRTVAIKLLRSEFAGQADFRHRFEREARAISALNHPHICSLYDVGEQDGLAYLVMEHVDGQTLAQVLTRGPLPVERALQYAIEITDALRTAHAHGIIHRDLKPGNIMIAGTGVKVLDFGLAKLSEHAAPADAETLTETEGTRAGQILGTVAYMSPEQAEGKPLDARSDVFSLGIVLYEMLCAQRPFRGETRISTLAAILRETPETPSRVRTGIPLELERIVLRCLQKQPEARYGSADDLHTALQSCRHSLSGRTGNIPWRRPAVIAAVLAVALAAGALGIRFFVRASRVRWAERVAVPEISRLMTEQHPLAALRLLRQAEPYAASSPELIRLRDQLVGPPVSIVTTPPGAEISVTEYAAQGNGDASREEFLGQSPLTTQRVPIGYYRLRVVKKGFGPIEQAASINFGANLKFQLHTSEETPGGMGWVAGTQTQQSARVLTYPALAAADIPPFWIDRYEVTNRQFKEFLDRGGYRNREYWKQPFLKDGRTVSWEQAMAEFRDATGKPGPASWELGTYPDGRADYPVGGVSWYEAAAYAEFAGKSLPTVYHWYLAASVGAYSDVLNLSNFAGQGPARVGSYRGLGEYGTYDMAGNVKEWCWNLAGDRRYILGGGWNEPNYQFKTPDARRPFDRDPTFGFRCIKPVSPPEETLAGIVSFVSRDRRNDKPADDRTFRIFQDLHSYDKTDLKARVEAADESPTYWRSEEITFQAAYGNERVNAHLYLPKNAAPPYQVVAYFGGANILTGRQFGRAFEFVVRSGRAFIVPAYKGTLERGPGDYYHLLGQPNRWREMNLQQSKDLGRTIDYLETRPDIDTRKLGFFGSSYGAAMAPHMAAAEPRIRCVVMVSGGSFERVPAEVDSWNFAPRVKAPVLMVNGRDDFRFPLETSQRPMFHLLGTPEKDKRHVVLEGGHLAPAGRPDIIKEILDWLDRYLGPVQTK